MADFDYIQHGFNGGEMAPNLYGRSDIDKYASSVRRMENFYATPQGPAIRRSGSRFVLAAKSSAVKGRLVPFVFSDTQAYVLEFGNLIMRVFRNEGVVGAPFELVTTYTESDLPDLHFAQSADTLFVTHKDFPPRKITRTAHTSWSIADIDFLDGPYLEVNTTATTMAVSVITLGASMTITASAVTGINGGAGFLASDVGRYVRIGHASGDDIVWGWAEITALTDTTHVVATVRGAFSQTGAVATWRISAWGSASDLLYPRTVSFFEERLWFAANAGQPQTIWGSVSGDFETFIPTGDPTADYPIPEGIQDDNGVTYTIADSKVNVIRHLAPLRSFVMGTSSAIWTMQASTQLEAITPTNVQLKRSTAHGSHTAQAVFVGDQALYISDTRRKVFGIGFEALTDSFAGNELSRLAQHIPEPGIVHIDYAEEPNSIVYAVLGDGVLAGMTYVPREEVFAWHRHILGGSFQGGDAVVESIAVIPSPTTDYLGNAVDSDHDQVWLIVKRTIGGSTVRYIEFLEQDFGETAPVEDEFFVDGGLTLDGANATDPETITGATQEEPVVLTIASHNYSDGEEIRITHVQGMTQLNGNVYVVASAGANSFALNTLEGDDVDGTEFSAYITGGQTRKRTTAISNLDHLEGESVDILADGAVQNAKTVASGAIILDQAASEVHVGLGFASDIETIDPEVPTRRGSSQGKLKRAVTLNLRLHRTVGGSLCSDPTGTADFDPIIVGPEPVFGEPPPLFSGDTAPLTLNCGWDRDARQVIRQNQPFPMTVTALMAMIKVSPQ